MPDDYIRCQECDDEFDPRLVADWPVTECPDCIGAREQRTQHTPGPWTAYSGHDNKLGFWAILQGDGPNVIARLDEPGDANAALIAAAPALLAACEAALDLLNNLTTEEFRRGGDKPARDALTAAIAAARAS